MILRAGLAAIDFRIAAASKKGPVGEELEPVAASWRNLAAREAGTSAWMEMRAPPSACIAEDTEAEHEDRRIAAVKNAAPRHKDPAIIRMSACLPCRPPLCLGPFVSRILAI
jgi:hypothetical protein